MKVAVTGAAGFIGANLVKRFLEDGHEVTGIDLDFPSNERRVYGVEYFRGDLRDKDVTRKALFGAEWVVALAADMGGVGYFHKTDYSPYLNNSLITINTLNACGDLGIERLFYASSACAYPTELQREVGAAPKLSEELLGGGTPDQMYGREKLAGALLCERAPFDARCGILHTVFGPLQEREGERMKFPTAIATKALQAKKDGRPIEVWGDGKQLRSYLFIDDAVERICSVLYSDNYEGPVNIGAEGAVSCKAIAGLCLELVGIPHRGIVYNDKEPSGVLARDCDNTKFRATYGIDPRRSYQNGFGSLMEWLLNAELRPS